MPDNQSGAASLSGLPRLGESAWLSNGDTSRIIASGPMLAFTRHTRHNQ
jgi:hypothetical protein